MKIATQTDALVERFGDKRAVEILCQSGFTGIDYSMFDMYKEGRPLNRNDYADHIKKIKETADSFGVPFVQSHAPFPSAKKDDAKFNKTAFTYLERAFDVSHRLGVEIMVVHVFRGIGQEAEPTKEGIENFMYVIEEARKKNVKIAFENTEGEAYIEAIFKNFGGCENVFFCWDTGHELCYNRGNKMMDKYGKYIISTHLNDNMGVRDADGKISSADDMHMLLFDGVADWVSIAEELKKFNFTDILSFEVRNTYYPEDTLESFFEKAYTHARKFLSLF